MKKKTTSTEADHEHQWKQAFTETKNGSIVKSFLKCTLYGCKHEDEILGAGWKSVVGSFDKTSDATYSVVNSKY